MLPRHKNVQLFSASPINQLFRPYQSIKFIWRPSLGAPIECLFDLAWVQKWHPLNKQGHSPSTADRQMTAKVPGCWERWINGNNFSSILLKRRGCNPTLHTEKRMQPPHFLRTGRYSKRYSILWPLTEYHRIHTIRLKNLRRLGMTHVYHFCTVVESKIFFVCHFSPHILSL